MRFESPWLLLGMLAAAIPVIIHLINRQRARLRRFAAVEFLLLSDKRVARRLKVRQILVLALRVGLLLALPFALAKPYLEDERLVGSDLADPGAVALVVDDSLSMQARDPADPARTLLDRAREEAMAAVRAGGQRTSFAIVAAGAPARLLTPGLEYDRQTLERAVARLTPAARAGDLSGALREAERVLGTSPEPRRRVLVIGDQAAHAWAGLNEPWALSVPPEVRLVDVREGQPLPNLAVTGVTVRPAPDVGPGQIRVEVTVANHGPEEVTVPVTVDVGGDAAAATLTVPPRASQRVDVVERMPAGRQVARGRASLAADALEGDDTWWFTVDFGGTVRVGVVNGAPRNVPWLDEVFFLRTALEAAAGDQGRIQPVWLAPDQLDAARLESLDAVVLANVGSLTGPQRIALEAFVRRGGGLLTSAGEQLTPESAATYGPLLPYPLRSVKQVAKPGDPAAALRALHLDQLDATHPALAEFLEVDEVSLLKALTYTYALVDTTTRPDARVVASFSGGAPALVEASLDRGRVMMLTTTLDRDWSDLVVRTSYVPLVQNLVLYLAGRLDRPEVAGHRVGEVAEVPLPEGQGPLVLERPDGTTVPLEAPTGPDERTVQVGDLDLPGIYTLRRRLGQPPPVLFAVNADRAESDLSPADTEAVRAVLERPGPGAAPAAVAQAPGSPAPPDSRRRKLWPMVLVGLFWLLASEAWLVIRG